MNKPSAKSVAKWLRKVEEIATVALAAVGTLRRILGKEANTDWSTAPEPLKEKYRDLVKRVLEGKKVDNKSEADKLLITVVNSVKTSTEKDMKPVPLAESHSNAERELADRLPDIKKRNEQEAKRMEDLRAGIAPSSPAENEVSDEKTEAERNKEKSETSGRTLGAAPAATSGQEVKSSPSSTAAPTKSDANAVSRADTSKVSAGNTGTTSGVNAASNPDAGKK